MTPQATTIRMPTQLYERLRTRAFSDRRSHQDVIITALREYLDALDRTPAELRVDSERPA